MPNKQIFTENPENDLWQELMQFSYKANVERYLEEHNLVKSEDTINTIIGSFLQANEYFKASKTVNLQISPLLLYYGSTNLLLGLCSLKKGIRPEIKNHGMATLHTTIDNYISEASVRFNDYNFGGIHQFAKIIGFDKDLTKYGEWKMQEFLSAIVEIDRDYKKCYEKEIGNTLLLDLYNTSTGLIEKIYAKKEIMESILNVLNNVEDFKKNYLDYQTGYEKETNRNYLILRKRMTGKNIKKISFSGQPYLQAGIEKNGQLITLPQLFNMYSALFIMGSLCRYHPEIWGPFVLNDETGERLLFEKFIYYSRRIIIPNIVLNIINNDDITYVTQRYSTNETIKHVNEHDVKELVRNEIYDIEEKRRMMK